MQHGIYYAYWEHEWDGDYHYYIDKVSRLGFDILEIAAGPLPEYSDEGLKELKSMRQIKIYDLLLDMVRCRKIIFQAVIQR